jgi:cytochrome c
MANVSWPALILAIVAAMIFSARASGQATTKGLGRTATAEEIRAWDTAVRPDGEGLPPGSGTVSQGAALYAKKCVMCHGRSGEGTKLAPQLVGGELRMNLGLLQGKPEVHIGSGWPYAPMIFEYINRAMPWRQGGTLPADEVYALTAFLLFKNGIIKEDEVMNAQTLPKVQMPNRNGYVPPPVSQWKPGMRRPFKID